jgi:transposase InsO family protein
VSSFSDADSFQSWNDEPCLPRILECSDQHQCSPNFLDAEPLSYFSNPIEFHNFLVEPCSSRALESSTDDFSLVRHHISADRNTLVDRENSDRGRSSLILPPPIGVRSNQRSYDMPSCGSKVIFSGVKRGAEVSSFDQSELPASKINTEIFSTIQSGLPVKTQLPQCSRPLVERDNSGIAKPDDSVINSGLEDLINEFCPLYDASLMSGVKPPVSICSKSFDDSNSSKSGLERVMDEFRLVQNDFLNPANSPPFSDNADEHTVTKASNCLVNVNSDRVSRNHSPSILIHNAQPVTPSVERSPNSHRPNEIFDPPLSIIIPMVYDVRSDRDRVSEMSKSRDAPSACIPEGVRVPSVSLSPIKCSRVGESLWVMITVNDDRQIFNLDSGSQVSLLRRSFGSRLHPTDLQVQTATGQDIDMEGEAKFLVEIEGYKFEHRMYVSSNIHSHTLGTDFLVKAGCVIDLKHMKLWSEHFSTDILTRDEVNTLAALSVKQDARTPILPDVIVTQFVNCPAAQRESVFQDFLKYEHLFNTLGTAKNVQFEINLTDPRPIKQAVRRVSAAQREVITTQVEEMLKLGVIRKSASPWSTPAVLVKKTTGEWRFCCDFRQLNDRTHKDSFPLPRIDEVLTNLQGAKYFSTLDLRMGFWQVLVKPEDVPKTAFAVPDGLYEFVKLPFGLANAPSCFQRMMTEVLQPLLNRGAQVYIDDVVIYGRTWEEMLARLLQTFELLDKAGLTLNPKKCKFFATEINLLGHRVTQEGCTVLDDKVAVIQTWPEPTTRKQVRSFLGLSSYYRAHVKDFAHIAAPLHKLTSVKAQWKWSEHERNAFEQLKRALSTTPVLQLFDPDKEVVLDCDASLSAVGAVLSQKDENGLEHPVGFYSRCLSRAESNYCATRRELFSVICSLKHWRHLLLGQRITVRSDHGSLVWLKNFKQPEAQLARWLEFISQYDMEIVYRPGAKSQNADGLSRRGCPPACSYCSRREQLSEERVALRNVHLRGEIDWMAEQIQDPELVEVRKWVRENNRPPWEQINLMSPGVKSMWREWDHYHLKDDILMRKFFTPQTEYFQVVIPRHKIQAVLEVAHSQGHWGIERTKLSIRSKFYWPGWSSDVTQHVKQCIPCIRKKGPPKRQIPTFQKNLAGSPMERINMDFLGPLQQTPRGNRHLLVVTDTYTKWVIAIPLQNQEASTVADALIEHVITPYGVPSQLHSDQAPNFESELIKKLCERLGISKTRSSAYHPQGNGQTERANRTLIAALAKVLERDSEWDLVANLVTLYYNASVHKATGYSPAMLVLGRELAIPADVLCPPVRPSLYKDWDDYQNSLEKRLHVAHEFARKHLEFDWSLRERASENLVAMKPLDPTRDVFIFNPRTLKGRARKFASFWAGPYRILEQLSERLYRVKVGGRAPVRVVNRSNIYQP